VWVTIGGVTVRVRIGRMGGENLVGLNKAVRAAFDALAPSARKEHARSVADAKRADTRARRVAAVVAALRGA